MTTLNSLCFKPTTLLSLIFFIALLFAPASEPAVAAGQLGTHCLNELITWNVGQGQWVTWEHEEICDHFDLGGEFAPWEKIDRHCRGKFNRAHLSHWDWDHIGLAARAAAHLKNFCVADFPRGPAPSKGKEKILSLPACDFEQKNRMPTAEQLLWQDPNPMSELTSNDLSRVFSAGGAVIPGDSTIKEEIRWSPKTHGQDCHLLVLGHHGSRTSTSDALLNKLPRVRMAIASARRARYGHPHAEVLQRLKKHRIAAIKTEDWGSVLVEIPDKSPITKH